MARTRKATSRPCRTCNGRGVLRYRLGCRMNERVCFRCKATGKYPAPLHYPWMMSLLAKVAKYKKLHEGGH